jgi:hypothetical protein
VYRSKKFSLSVASYSIKIENFAEIKSQIYCDASYFHEAIIDRFQIFKIFPKKLLMLLLHRIGIAFLYMDSEDSNLIRGETTFHKNGSKEIVIKEISNPKLKHKWYLKNRISKIFNKSGLFTLPFFINFEKTGQAFHSTIIKTNSEFIIEDSSTLNNLQSRVSVSGLNLDNSYHNGSQASFLLSTNLF